tara:strand:+ start:1948 stop:2199 length:252 start_codon:yes stop_codon:yes gene_type:complete
MFFEKWFDEGDLILFKPLEGFASYDDRGNMSSTEFKIEPEICMFLEYPNKSSCDTCEIFIISQEKKLIVSQFDISLLSKNVER